MSSTFVLRDRDEFVKNVLFSAAILTIFPLFTGLVGEWLIGFAMQAFGVVGLALHEAGKPYELEISDRGALAVRRMWRSRTMAVRDIFAIKGKRIVTYDGPVVWEMEIEELGGHRTTIEYFDRAKAFVDELVTLKPGIEVSGEWPYIGFPELTGPVPSDARPPSASGGGDGRLRE